MSAKQFEIIYGINTVYEIIKNKANSIEHVYFFCVIQIVVGIIRFDNNYLI